jgi:hypothetical protein
LVKYCGLSLTEAMDLPISVRKWWIEREKKQREADKPKSRA